MPNAPVKHIYFNVPYSERGKAKSLDMKWNRRKKSWYTRNDNPKIGLIRNAYERTGEVV